MQAWEDPCRREIEPVIIVPATGTAFFDPHAFATAPSRPVNSDSSTNYCFCGLRAANWAQ
ncbi:hypothetical protein M407DRAFT_241732 [Tulasnella calospora MUT 4182]|uniref:Uncharacterized protein n=1 Tax=Tulasnella calospora MUT 4182 TaxID=1051891 RepID=A0A0C3QS08_9AGAM|nr:hypothetical protein M407DRAFT_241732 [Tulasnella calospora MUT 4182]